MTKRQGWSILALLWLIIASQQDNIYLKVLCSVMVIIYSVLAIKEASHE